MMVTMNITLLISAHPYNQSTQLSAHRLALAFVKRGHHLSQVFFYQEAVHTASRLCAPPSDMINLTCLWQDLATNYGTYLNACHSAALTRGVTPEVLADGFHLTGLGVWIKAASEADRVLSFGDLA